MEGIKSLPISYWSNCPFRGQPHIPIDERCPTSLPVFLDAVVLREVADTDQPKYGRGRPKKDEVREVRTIKSDSISMPVPMMGYESYCRTCTSENIREKEMGIGSRTVRKPKKL